LIAIILSAQLALAAAPPAPAAAPGMAPASEVEVRRAVRPGARTSAEPDRRTSGETDRRTSGAADPARKAAPSRSGSRKSSSTAGANPPPTHVEADHIEYRYKERETVMTGKPLVTLVREDATLVCRKLVAENDEAGEIRHAVCEGDVKLTRGERIVTCARATYEAATGRVVCRGDPVLRGGDPVLRDGASVMACDELVYELDDDRVLLTRPKGTLVQKPGQGLPVAKGRAR
jgi:hypothetical protein